jgi:hypothetical protein
VRVVSTMRHLSSRNRWILTGTFEAQSANPSFTVTLPLATRCLRRLSVIVRAWIVGSITVKAVALVAVPPGVVTAIGPVVARAGTVAVILVSETTVKVARVPLNLTAEAPVKPVPMMVTDVPAVPLVGLNDVMVGSGDGVTVKFVALATVVPCLVTEIGPVVAPAGTMAVICEFEFTVNVALVPLNRTRLAPVKPTPVITTDVPITPLVGLNDVIAKPPAVTVKLVALVAVPPGVVTAIGPVVAPPGTVAVIWVFESTVKLAVVLLNFTAEAPRKPVPVTCTEVPTGPLVGSNEVIVGTGEAVTVKFVALVAVPSGFVTEIAPVLAPAGTVAVIVCVLLIVKVAETPSNRTAVTSGSGPLKLSPVISTGVPTGPLVGVNDEMVGAAANADSAPGMAIVSATSRTTKEVWAARRRILIMTPPSQSGRCTDP